MKSARFSSVVVLSLIISWIPESLQAKVDESCPPSETGTAVQCLSVTFGRSVQEGHDDSVEPMSGKSSFKLVIYSNTEKTSELLGYNVTISSGCSSSDGITVKQKGSASLPVCNAEVIECSSSDLVIKLQSNAETIKSNVFYAEVSLTWKPSGKFNLNIKPLFASDPDSVYTGDSQPFTKHSLSDIDANDATTCEVMRSAQESDNMPHIKAGVGMAIFFALILILAAVISKLHTKLADKFICKPSAESRYVLFNKEGQGKSTQYEATQHHDAEAVMLKEKQGTASTEESSDIAGKSY